MSQPTHAATQALEEQIAGLMSEIAFQKVLLASIDDTVQNREAAEDEVRYEIKILEKQLRALRKPRTPTSAPQLRATGSSQRSEATPSTPLRRRPSDPASGDENGFGTAMNGLPGES